MNRREGRSQILDVGPKKISLLFPHENIFGCICSVCFFCYVLHHQLLNAIWSIATKRRRFFILLPLEFAKKIYLAKKIGWDLRNLMIMTISFNASLLPDFTIIFAAALRHGKTNLRTTFSFIRWAKPPNKTNFEHTILMKQTNSEFEVQSFVGFTAHLIAHIFSFQLFSDSGQFNLV